MAYKDPIDCPVCRRGTYLNMDGNVRKHDRPPLPGYGLNMMCPASEQPAEEAARLGRIERGEATAEDERETLLREAISGAQGEADIDGYGDEGAGYDFRVFARALEAAGWTYSPKGDS